MTWNWIRRGNAYLSLNPWPAIRFQPVLYLMLFGGALRLAINPAPPPKFDIIATNFYVVWLAMGLVGPVLALVARWMIENRSGRWRFLGMWLRLSADIQVLTVMMSYHLVATIDRNPSESKIFSRYIFAAAMIFVLLAVIRDMWTLFLTERIASQIHREERDR